MKTNDTWRGFTLIELLVVVLIIGVLAAIALPMYQKAVLKSRFAALMPIGKAMADSNEAYYLEHGNYATNVQELPVQGQEEYPAGTEVELAPGLEYAYVLVSNDLARNNYIVYQKHSEKFPDNIHCEALEDDAQANEICTSLGGEYIPGSLTDGYKTYVLSGNIGTDKLPTSLTKLVNTVCEEDTNCTAHIEGDTVVSESCTGNKNTYAGQTCIARTYNDTGTQIDYERTVQSCVPWSNNEFSNATQCTTKAYDEQNNKTKSSEDICNLDKATLNNGVCTWTGGGGKYYMHEESEGGKVKRAYYSCYYASANCAQNTILRTEWEGGQLVTATQIEYYPVGEEKGLRLASTYWKDESQNLKTTLSQGINNVAYPSGGDVTFTTTNTQTNEVVGTVSCAFANADWDTGTCKPGTAI